MERERMTEGRVKVEEISRNYVLIFKSTKLNVYV